MRDLRVLVALLGDLERLFERAELAAQRRDLLVEHLDLRQRAQRHLLLGVELAGELGDLALRGRGAAAEAVVEALVAVALAFGGGEAGAQLRDLLFERQLAGLLQRQQLGELRDPRVQPRSAVSLPVTSCDRKNCTTTNTVSRKMMPRTSVDSASTKPGQ